MSNPKSRHHLLIQYLKILKNKQNKIIIKLKSIRFQFLIGHEVDFYAAIQNFSN